MQHKFFSSKLAFLFHKRAFSSTFNNPRDLNSPYQILGVSPSASLAEIKKAYHNLSKIYHPDKNRSKDAIEKFKAINNAYNTLKEYHGEHASYRQRTSGFTKRQHQQTDQKNDKKTSEESYFHKTEEERLYEEVFGKSYISDPMFFYNKENNELRREYEKKLKNLRENQKEWEDKKTEEHFKGSHHYYRDHSENYTQEKTNPDDLLIWISFGAISLSILFLLYWTKKGPAPNLEQQKEMEVMVEKFRTIELKKLKDKLEKSKENYLKSLPKMKKYSILNEPDAEETLVDFTIYPDIKIYNVPHLYFYEQNSDINTYLYSKSFEKYKLRNLKLNAAISLSLEAERLLKNTFVNVNLLKKTIEEKGFYEPPGIFTRFFGFIYIKLRKMPMIVENLKPGLEWISLFDLYMHYHSPLPYINEDFFEFKINSQKFGWLGNVTLNHRKVSKIYLKGDEKNVFFWRGSKPINHPEIRYISVWDNFYKTSKEEYKFI